MKLILVLLALSSPAKAEYRAFELVITDSDKGTERVEVSSLTPAQYRQYYSVNPTESIHYRATWMCRGNTSFRKPVCPNPKAQ